MSVNVTFPSDIPLSGLESFNSNVRRTVDTIFELPWEKEQLYFQNDFFTHYNFNVFVDRFYDNLNYLDGYATLYNTVLPLDSSVCSEYNQSSKKGIALNALYEVTFTDSVIEVYQNGVSYQTIESTNFGKLRDIKDVIVVDNYIIVIDGNHILKLDISTNPLTFITFFGGYGGSDSEYKFQNPTKVIFDNDEFFIWDKGNNKVKHYNKAFSHLNTINLVDGVIDIGVYAGQVYILTNSIVQNLSTNVSFSHNIDTPYNILLDNTQGGFLWVTNTNFIGKFTINGLNVGRYTNYNNVTDVVRDGTRLYTLSDNIWYANLDYTFSETIINPDFQFSNFLTSIYIQPDEFVDDIVLNDTFHKFFENIDDINLSLSGRFVIGRNAQSNIQTITTESVPVSACEVDCNMFFSQDEIVACNTLNRSIDTLYDIMLKTGNKLLGFDVFINEATSGTQIDEEDFIPLNWTLGAQSCEGVSPQLFNPSFTPITFAEYQNPILECNPLTGGCV